MSNHRKEIVSLSTLNLQQKKAIKCSDDRVLVLAGAGAGKTKTLLQKILYLMQEKGAKPQEIMAITFTKNAANEMIDRLLFATDTDQFLQKTLEDPNLTASQKRFIRMQKMREHKWIGKLTIRTFHSLCYSILRNFGAKEFDNKFKLLTENTANDQNELRKISAPESQIEVLHKMLIMCCENKAYMLQFKKYIIDYMIDKLDKPSKAFLPNYDGGKYYTSLRGDKVRSKSEQYICDWLYRHNINYEYEPNVRFDEISFRPDFYIPDANLFLEHVSNLSTGMNLKEQQFINAGRLLVKTFEEMTHDTNLFNLMLTRIIKGRLPASYDFEKALHYEEEMRGKSIEIKDFLRQVLRILDIYQVDGQSLSQIREKSNNEKHERVRLFYQCALPIIEAYEKYCINKSYLDFNGLISKCIDLLKNEQEIKEKFHKQFKYLLVDEFQDVNRVQIQLIKNIIDPSAQLFCVGDDWQSIYGFRGSDVSYIVEFPKFFKNGKVIHLNKNYRSTSNIVTASNEIIKHNKYKIDKQITASRKSKRKIEVYAGTDLKDCVEFAVREVKELLSRNIQSDEILFLYRRSKMFEPYRLALKKEKIYTNNKTIHAAKGLEAKAVFIIGMTEGSGGFPDIWMEDRIYQLIRPSSHDLLLEEERRLFYVAVTRAKEMLYLITELGNESSFLDEIPAETKVVYSTPIGLSHIHVKKCGACNRKLEKAYRFCPYCGAEIE